MIIETPEVKEFKTPPPADVGLAMAEQIIALANGAVTATQLEIPITGFMTQLFAFIDRALINGQESVIRKVKNATGRAKEILVREEVEEAGLISALTSSITRMNAALPPLLEYPVVLLKQSVQTA